MPLEHIIIKEGNNKIRPKVGTEVTVHYVGKFHGTEKIFDSSRNRGQPFKFVLGARQVIAGWDQGVAMMCKGEVCKLVCPPELAYGPRGFPPVFVISLCSSSLFSYIFFLFATDRYLSFAGSSESLQTQPLISRLNCSTALLVKYGVLLFLFKIVLLVACVPLYVM